MRQIRGRKVGRKFLVAEVVAAATATAGVLLMLHHEFEGNAVLGLLLTGAGLTAFLLSRYIRFECNIDRKR